MLIYDGDCAFCTRIADWMMARGCPATSRRDADLPPELFEASAKSVLWLGDQTLDRSAAVVRSLVAMDAGWPLMGVALWLIPKPLRDWGYGFVARRWGPL